jgi:uncharacterized protein YodC (DUF2158 family)
MTDVVSVGDVVRLKSGGPAMTVDQLQNSSLGIPTAWCSWFDGMKKVTGDFPVSSLKRKE